MKKWLFILVTLAAFSSVAMAQVPSPVSLYLGGAVSIPQSPQAFADSYKTGYHGWAGLGLSLMPNLQAIGKFEYHRFALDVESNPLLTGEDISGHNNVMMFGVDGKYSFNLPSAPIKPFILGGGGLARMEASDLEGTSSLVASLNEYKSETTSDFYFNIGAGIDFKAAPMLNMFLQVRYVSIATEGESSSFIPVSLGFKFF